MNKLYSFIILLCMSYNSHSQQVTQIPLLTIDGSSTTLDKEVDLEKETIIAFWATWCGPCLKELDAIHSKLDQWKEEKDFNFVAITIDDQRGLKRVKPLVDSRGWEFDILADPNQEFARLFNVGNPPFTLILKDEKIAFAKSGFKPGDEDFLFAQVNTVNNRKNLLPKGLQLAIETNASNYLEDEAVDRVSDPIEDNRLRANSYVKADYQFLDHFRATVQLESYEKEALLDYSRIYEGTNLATYALNYIDDKIDVTAGHFYDQWGSGLAFRAFEDRQLGLNTAILGGRVKYMPSKNLNVTAIAGQQRYSFDVADSFLYGGNLEYSLLNEENSTLNLGFSALFKNEDLEEDAEIMHDETTRMLSGRVDYNVNDLTFGLEVNLKSEEPLLGEQNFGIQEEHLFDGNSIQLNAGYAKNGFGANGTFRRLESMSFFSERSLQGNLFNQGVLNYIPALTKQQDYSLMNRYVHVPISAVSYNFDFGLNEFNRAGEIGGQIDLFYNFKEGSQLGGKYGTNITVNASRWHNIDADYDYETSSYSNAKLLGFEKKYYSDINLEVRKRFSDKHAQIFTYLKQQNDELFKGVKADVVAWEGLFQTGKTSSLRTELQHMWADKEEREWWAATVEYGFNPNISLFAADMYNYGNIEERNRFHNYNFGTSFTMGSTRADLMYGRRPEGLLCVGGVCRQVSAASGLHLNFSTTLR